MNRETCEQKTEVDYAACDTRILRFLEKGLQKHYLPEDSLSEKPKIQEYISLTAVIDHVDAKDTPSYEANNRVLDGVKGEPGQPVGQVGHAHHSAGLFGA